ncbi:MAG: enoyl-CoA hydratase/isomerase family protein [Bradyrhizobium sp.]|nr:enoyl-CoA hydratase/isomerase family protein [Bradyrhizobium sp.]
MTDDHPAGATPPLGDLACDDLAVAIANGVAVVEIRRPPSNFFDAGLIDRIADVFEALDRDPQCRAIVLAAQGKAFCAGANHRSAATIADTRQAWPRPVYQAAIRLFRTKKPIIAAVHGAAVGGGLGLALAADFRVTCPEARFWANFSQLGFHAGFGMTVTLPRLVGAQHAAMLLYTGRRVSGDEAVALGLGDLLVAEAEVRASAIAMAAEIASAAPLAVMSMRATLRRGLADEVEAAMDREFFEQSWQRLSLDFREGTDAMAARRQPVFSGR